MKMYELVDLCVSFNYLIAGAGWSVLRLCKVIFFEFMSRYIS